MKNTYRVYWMMIKMEQKNRIAVYNQIVYKNSFKD